MADPRQVRVEGATPAEVLFRGDEALLRQMLMNLLDNAVSYTPSGGVVSVTLHLEAEAIVLAVTDTGTGIPVADRERIFERFVRLDLSTKRASAGGAGLGLPIARWIAEAHGGTLTLDASFVPPAAENGTRFIVRLPIDPRIAATTADPTEARATSPPISNARAAFHKHDAHETGAYRR
jgi:signal transduction histidine kinase